ncbi:hypothetical protein HDE_08450 [Halotydeus destructor]|nr:hypothetical protein HDE_08450 [Halotydeus destructor]
MISSRKAVPFSTMLESVAPVLDENGGITSAPKLKKLIRLVYQTRKLNVKMCIILMLQNTNDEVVSAFFEEMSGWVIMIKWMKDSLESGSHAIPLEIIKILCRMTPCKKYCTEICRLLEHVNSLEEQNSRRNSEVDFIVSQWKNFCINSEHLRNAAGSVDALDGLKRQVEEDLINGTRNVDLENSFPNSKRTASEKVALLKQFILNKKRYCTRSRGLDMSPLSLTDESEEKDIAMEDVVSKKVKFDESFVRPILVTPETVRVKKRRICIQKEPEVKYFEWIPHERVNLNTTPIGLLNSRLQLADEKIRRRMEPEKVAEILDRHFKFSHLSKSSTTIRRASKAKNESQSDPDNASSS